MLLILSAIGGLAAFAVTVIQIYITFLAVRRGRERTVASTRTIARAEVDRIRAEVRDDLAALQAEVTADLATHQAELLVQLEELTPKTLRGGHDPAELGRRGAETRETNKADRTLANAAVALEALGDELGGDIRLATWAWEEVIPERIKAAVERASEHKVLEFAKKIAPKLAKMVTQVTPPPADESERNPYADR